MISNWFAFVRVVGNQRCHRRQVIFQEYSLSVPSALQCSWNPGNIYRTFDRERFFKKFFDGKVLFILKVYHLIITNVDLLENSINHKIMLPEYWRNIPRIAVSKIFQGYLWNIVRFWKHFQKSKSSKKCFVSYPVKIFILAISSLAMFVWILLKPFYI